MQKYDQELEYLFLRLGVGYMLAMLYPEYVLKKEEWKFLTESVKKLFPDVLQNVYLNDDSNEDNKVWNHLLQEWLTMEITDENVQTVNQYMVDCTQK